MADSEKPSSFDIKGFSLIDVSSEDDCLILSPLCDPINSQSSEKRSESKSVRFAMDPESVDISLGSPEEAEKLEEQPDSSEQDKTRKSEKYNLRKSLAWDSAFFTSAGVLDPEELSSMMGGNEKEGGLHSLPEIQEDINKSCDSLATMDDETLTLQSLEADLFEDIRASIQKSNKASNIANSSDKKELKTKDAQSESSSKKVESAIQDKVDLFEDIRASIQKSNKASNIANSSGKKELKTKYAQSESSSKKVESAIQDKMKQKASPKKPNVGLKDSGRTLKQISVRPQTLQTVQSVARSRESTSSLHKPPKAVSRVSSISTTPSKRVSSIAKTVKMEKDAKSRGAAVSKSPSGGLRNMVPKPAISSKSSSCSPASTKTELTTSCSSLESCASTSSSRITTSLNLIKQKKDSVRTIPSSSGRTISTPSKVASKGKNQPGSSKLSTFLKSSTKISSSISPASSISECSSVSTSSISSVSQRSNIVRSSLGTGSHKGLGTSRQAHQVLDSHTHHSDQDSMGDVADISSLHDENVNIITNGNSGLIRPAYMKPSGLRMPSPKIGFFDGVRSSGCTPNGSMLSHPGVPSGLPKTGAKSSSSSGSSIKARIGKPQPARALTAIQSPKIDEKGALRK